MKMRKSTVSGATAAVLLLVAALASAAGPVPVNNLARYFPGDYKGATPGNDLLVKINPITIDMIHPYDYFVTITGRFEKTSVFEQGVVRIEPQGNSIYMAYIPHFNPGVTSVSPQAGNFNADELNASCGIYLRIEGDGFAGETRPSDCARAIRGTAARSWRVEIEPNRITLKDARSGETLRFEKGSKSE
jgi:hypothetical protein